MGPVLAVEEGTLPSMAVKPVGGGLGGGGVGDGGWGALSGG